MGIWIVLVKECTLCSKSSAHSNDQFSSVTQSELLTNMEFFPTVFYKCLLIGQKTWLFSDLSCFALKSQLLQRNPQDFNSKPRAWQSQTQSLLGRSAFRPVGFRRLLEGVKSKASWIMIWRSFRSKIEGLTSCSRSVWTGTEVCFVRAVDDALTAALKTAADF